MLTPRFGDFTNVELYEGCAYVTQRDDEVWRIFSEGPSLPPAMELIDKHDLDLGTLRVRYPSALRRAEHQIAVALHERGLELHTDPAGNYSIKPRTPE